MFDRCIEFVKVNCYILMWMVIIIISLYLFYVMVDCASEVISKKEKDLEKEAFKKVFFDEVFTIPSLDENDDKELYEKIREANKPTFKAMVESVIGFQSYDALMKDESIKDKKEYFIAYVKEIREERNLTGNSDAV